MVSGYAKERAGGASKLPRLIKNNRLAWMGRITRAVAGGGGVPNKTSALHTTTRPGGGPFCV